MASPLVLPSIRSLFPALETTLPSRPYWDPVRLDAALLPPADLSTTSDIESESEQKPELDADIEMPEPEQKQEQEPVEQSPTPPRRRGRDVRGPRARKFPCDICPSVFERPSSLDQHKRSHTGEKRTSFATCNPLSFTHAIFSWPYLAFSCEICGKRFSVSSNARRHDRTCHAEVVCRTGATSSQCCRCSPRRTRPSFARRLVFLAPDKHYPPFSHRSASSHHYQPRRLHFDPSQPSLVDKKSGHKHAKNQFSDPSLRVLMTTKASYPNEMEVDMPTIGNPYRLQQRPQIPQVGMSPQAIYAHRAHRRPRGREAILV
ncbi:hypothetical protein BS47DRAFT_181610 [Hydnum rufescens UP504]|uniref:C2H2-type domain-containing protein n=1 Tax=Hydnum rufescens UP504 TaxID=1448309 RepID=A0A9P6AQF8_9AGAM|nr:hypothetical protein BS47DRAFT_181610 [Hydnum rufescens UP504]